MVTRAASNQQPLHCRRRKLGPAVGKTSGREAGTLPARASVAGRTLSAAREAPATFSIRFRGSLDPDGSEPGRFNPMSG